MKRILAGLLFTLWSSIAVANVPCSLPFNLLNGTTADATQVMANYNALVTCLTNAAIAGANNDITSLTGLTTPITPAEGGTTVYVGGTSGGTANVQTVGSITPTTLGPSLGQRVVFVAGLTNTSAATLNVNSTGAKNVYRYTPAGPIALAGGEIVTGNIVEVIYDGTQYVIYTPASRTLTGPFTFIAGATTTDIGLAINHYAIISSAATITGFGSTASTTYPVYFISFGVGGSVLTYNATSLILPGSADITTAAGDFAIAFYIGSGNWRVVSYNKVSGAAVATAAPTRQVFTSGSGLTYTTPANVRWIRIRAVGGGAGGGGGNSSSTSTGGGTTLFGGILSAGGGSGGSSIIQAPAGGAASGGNIMNINGGAGGPPSGAANAGSGVGGSSCLGGAGGGNDSTGTGGAAAPNSGSGGGGGGGNATTSVPSGGASGGCVEHVIASPIAAYSYTVGAGGAGAAGSGGGGTGGAGAAGIIIVEEFY